MLTASDALPYCECLTVEWLRLSQLPLPRQQAREVVERHKRVWMLRTLSALSCRETLARQWLCLCQFPLLLQQERGAALRRAVLPILCSPMCDAASTAAGVHVFVRTGEGICVC